MQMLAQKKMFYQTKQITGVKRWSFPMNKTRLKNDIIIVGLTVLDIKSNMYEELKRQFL